MGPFPVGTLVYVQTAAGWEGEGVRGRSFAVEGLTVGARRGGAHLDETEARPRQRG